MSVRRYSPGGAIDPKASHCDLGVLQVDAVGEQRLHVFIVLWLELGSRGEVVEVLLDQVGHELLVEGQLMVSCDDYLDVIRQGTWHERKKETCWGRIQEKRYNWKKKGR